MAIACGNENLSEWELEHGFGPIDEPVELADLDSQLAGEGHYIFTAFCEDCHTVEAQIVGPALNTTVNRRSAEFIMNYIINPEENRENHPASRELAELYPVRMINLSMTRDEARAIYEYLRYYNETGEHPPWE